MSTSVTVPRQLLLFPILRECPFLLSENPPVRCRKPIEGQGRHQWCSVHSPIVRAQQQRQNNALNVRRYRQRHTLLFRFRRMISNAFIKYLDSLIESAEFTDSDCIQLHHTQFLSKCTRFFRQIGNDVQPLHVFIFPLPNGYYANIACEMKIQSIDDIYMIVFSKQKLMAPCISRCPGFPEENSILTWVCYASYFMAFFRCGTPRWKNANEAYTVINFPHFFYYMLPRVLFLEQLAAAFTHSDLTPDEGAYLAPKLLQRFWNVFKDVRENNTDDEKPIREKIDFLKDLLVPQKVDSMES